MNKINCFKPFFKFVSIPVSMAKAAILDFTGYFCVQLLSTFPNNIFSEIFYMGCHMYTLKPIERNFEISIQKRTQ